MNYTKEQIEFLKSLDFMKLGQAINREQWQAAAMTMRRLDMKAKETGMNDFERNFTGIRQCVNRKDANEAKQIAFIITYVLHMLLEKNIFCLLEETMTS